jgi:hypothetical protein
MISKEQFGELSRAIVADVFPGELLAFDMSAKELIEGLYRGDDIREQHKGAKGEYAFLSQATDVLKFIGLLGSTYTLLKNLYSTGAKGANRDSTERLAHKWAEVLKKRGLNENEAEVVARKFSKQVEALLAS